jgi:hypothetical protein
LRTGQNILRKRRTNAVLIKILMIRISPPLLRIAQKAAINESK